MDKLKQQVNALSVIYTDLKSLIYIKILKTFMI